MGEAAAVAAAFDAALAKTLGALSDAPPASAHEATIAHRRQCERVHDTVAYYMPPRLPAVVWARRATAAGTALVARRQYTLAADACFAPVHALPLLLSGNGGSGSATAAMPELELHIQAALGLAICRGSDALLLDPHVSHADTLAAALHALRDVRAAAMLAFPHEGLYHLVHDATVAIANVAQPLMDSGFCGAALAFLVFAAKVRNAAAEINHVLAHACYHSACLLTVQFKLIPDLTYLIRQHPPLPTAPPVAVPQYRPVMVCSPWRRTSRFQCRATFPGAQSYIPWLCTATMTSSMQQLPPKKASALQALVLQEAAATSMRRLLQFPSCRSATLLDKQMPVQTQKQQQQQQPASSGSSSLQSRSINLKHFWRMAYGRWIIS